MKKILILAIGIVLIAAACNKTTGPNNDQQTSQESIFKYAPYNFEFKYSNDWEFTSPAYATLNEKIVQVQLPQSAYPKTNFGDAAFTVSFGSANSLDACLALNANKADFKTTQIINSTMYYKAETSGVGAGNLYESRVYRTFKDSSCFELMETVHTSNIGNYEPGTVTEVNKTEVWQRLDKILNSFKFNS